MGLAARLLGCALLLPALLPAPRPASAQEEAERRAALRSSITDLSLSLRRMGTWGGALPQNVPSFTEQVNALLAADRGDLVAVLGEMLRAESAPKKEDEWRPNPVKRIAAFLVGIAPTANRKFEGEFLVEVHGFVLVDCSREEMGMGHRGPAAPPEPEVAIGPDTKFREPLRPRPFDLLKSFLGEAAPATTGSRNSWGSPGSVAACAGLELGAAARRDPEFAKFLLAVAAEEHPGEEVTTLITAALGRWAGPGAVAELTRRLRKAMSSEDEAEWHRSVAEASAALTDAGADAAIATLIKEEGGSIGTAKAAGLAQIAGGDAAVGALLERAEKDPTIQNLGALAHAINNPMEPKETVALRLRAFAFAARVRAETKDDAVKGWCFAVMQNSLWAGLYWRFGHMQGKNFSEDADREAPMPWGAKVESERDYFLGAWPEAEKQGVAIREDLEAKRIRVDERWSGTFGDAGPGEAIELWMDRAPESDPGVDVKGRRDGAGVEISLTNRRKVPVAVNTLAAKYAVAVMVPLKGDPKGKVELDLQAGRLLSGYRVLAKPENYRRIAPGETFAISFALGKLPEGSRVLFTLRDEMVPDGDLGVPWIRQIWELAIP